MLRQSIVDEVVELIDEGMSYRQIALRVGVSRGVVGNIASGTRHTQGRSDAAKSGNYEYVPVAKTVVARCRKCGVRVAMPCVKCKADAYRNAQRNSRQPVSTSPPSSGMAPHYEPTQKEIAVACEAIQAERIFPVLRGERPISLPIFDRDTLEQVA